MKNLIVLSFLITLLLSGCSSLPQSDEPCISCGNNHAFIYDIDSQEISYCKDCYEARKSYNTQLKTNMKYGLD